ncbi:hypothetical protein CHRY9390_01061 [Chryseobacterium aquaeductus]|uniref:Uncharacterized protein n=1 Tax=Chryseobacterium aquaeductus TaxID=2675056 RepID=A0A9N8MFS3_9FLAO|nr:hypothetical protein [Chryseobacterium aquaeductus]CAA7330393.1 hypothetical protein CHRY9390_01061 [Chryseobacterium potabilaquae]CAD7803322.1 hypothetical protein CHRY9390_01061 [Chryseobacterium aquaeductus]
MKKIKNLSKFVCLIVIFTLFYECRKKDGANHVNATERDSVKISKFTDARIKKILSELPVGDVNDYYKQYENKFNPRFTGGKFPLVFFVHNSVINELKKNYVKEGDFVHLLLTDTGRLDLLFVSQSDNRKYYITSRSSLKEVDNFNDLNNKFMSNIYPEMNTVKNNLCQTTRVGNSTYENTMEVIIPYDDFIKYNPKNSSVLTLIPGIITKDKKSSNGKSKMHHFTLIMGVLKENESKQLIWDNQYFYYDDFCLKPPGC